MRRPTRVLAALAVLLAFSVVACGSGASTAAAPAAKNMIVIKNFSFAPMTLTVAPGTKVSVKNEDTATHTLSSSKKAFDTGDISAGATTTFTAPAKPGTYTYICNIHQYMQGTLTVK